MAPVKWSAFAVLLALLGLPLSCVLSPYIMFCVYVRNLPTFSRIHVEDSLQSVIATASISIRLPFISIAETPVAQDRAEPPIHEVALAQRDFHALVVRFAPPTGAFTSLSVLWHAAESALALDDLIMLLEDGELELGGVGDIPLLVHISKASLFARDALFRVLVHVELAIARASFMQKTVVGVLALMEKLDLFGLSPPRCPRITAIYSQATSSSSHHIASEVEAAITATLDLLSALTKFNLDGRTQRQCTRPTIAASDSCADIAPLFDGVASVQSLLPLLAILKDVLEGRMDESWGKQVSALGFPVSITLMKASGEALDAMLQSVAEMRQTMQMGYQRV